MASRELSDADPLLASAFNRVKDIFERTLPGFELRVTCTHRSVEEQNQLFREGKSRLDGVTKKSLHNEYPSRAIDVGIFKSYGKKLPAQYVDSLIEPGRMSRELVTSLYWNVAQLFQRFGFRSGNDWNNNALPVAPDPAESLNDPYHVEIAR
jgi:hypothetical protein